MPAEIDVQHPVQDREVLDLVWVQVRRRAGVRQVDRLDLEDVAARADDSQVLVTADVQDVSSMVPPRPSYWAI